MNIKYFMLICFFIMLINDVDGQNKKMDSLNLALQNAKLDTIRLRIYFELCDACDVKDNLKYGEATVALIDKLIFKTSNEEQKKILAHKKAEAYNVIIIYYDNKGPSATQKALEYRQKRYLIYKESGDREGVKNSVMNIADFHSKNGNEFKRLEILKEGLALFEKWNYKNGMSRFVAQIGFLYADQGDTIQALNYLDKGIQIEKKIGDSTRIARGLFLKGIFYDKIKRNDKALECFLSVITRYEKIKDYVSMADVYLNIGITYKKIGDLENAIKYSQKSFDIGKQLNSLFIYGKALLILGEIYKLQGNFEKAIKSHKSALLMCEQNNINEGIALSCFALAQDFLSQKNYKLAKQNADRSLAVYLKEGITQSICEGEKLVATVDSCNGNFKDAFTHFQQYITLRDKLNNDEIIKAGQRERFQSEFEKQKAIDNLERKKQKEISVSENKKQKIITSAVAGALALVLIIAILVFQSLRKTRKQKQIIELQKKEVETQKLKVDEAYEELHQQNEEIASQRDEIEHQKHLVEEHQKEMVDSITYAKRIQDAILPPIDLIKEKLPNSFVLYKPKDIVAGDFYWMEEINDTILIAAADCTGHGVPGAMVSVVCSNALNRAVKEFHLSETGLILDKVTDLVLETFEKSTTEVKDGMDISLLSINKITKQIKWSGANNPLWFFEPTLSPSKEGSYCLLEITADKQPIGKSDYRKPFTTHTIEFKSNTTFYLFTDGYADQFGGPKGKKFKYKPFQEIIAKNLEQEQSKQQHILNEAFENWKGSLEQVDDVCVIGIKI